MKKRPASHVTGSTGAQLLRRLLPEEWVAREYQPDYGIDFAVEVFDAKGEGFVTLGEYFFVQLKSHSEVEWINKEVCARYNVEKAPLTYNRDQLSTIRVIAEPLETAELQLARSMGPATPLILVVVNTTRAEAHWVCLNDFVDKVLVPESGEHFSVQGSHTVHIPDFNCIDRTDAALLPLRFLARRAKLYAAFNRFRYQCHEISYALDRYSICVDHQPEDPNLLYLANHFLRTALAYDFWKTTHAWPAVELTHMYAEATADMISKAIAGEPLESLLGARLRNVPMLGETREEMLRFFVASDIKSTFDRLENLGNMFEEICREWFLPTYLGMLAEQHAIR
jgi:hypothetical protein